MTAPARTGESGQTLVLSVVVLFVLVAFSMIVMDGGSYLYVKRNMQGVADAAALAGARSFPDSSADAAQGDAREYIGSVHNGEDGAGEEQVTATTSGGSCTIDGVSMTLPAMSVCVTVVREQVGVFQGLEAFPGLGGLDNRATIRASAIATVSQLDSVSGWLPYGIRPSALDQEPPTQVAIRPRDGAYNDGGVINVPHGDNCRETGNSVMLVTPGEANGGEDACPVEIGETIRTQTGVQVGQVRQGFEDRLNGNTDAFFDVFGRNADGDWFVKDPDSPRLGFMPIADATGTWPLQGNASMTVRGFVLVYIGRTTSPDSQSSCPAGCPASANGGSNLEVYLTPVNAPLPERFDATYGEYDVDNPSPVIYRMTS